MLRSILFFFTLSSSCLIISPTNTLQASPTEDNSQKTVQKVTIPDNKKTKSKEKKEQTIEDKKPSPYANLTQQQLNQIKRYDCRLPKEIIPHDYLKKGATGTKK